jgi:signal transduction histidine kinase
MGSFWREELTLDAASAVTLLYGLTLTALASVHHLVLEPETVEGITGPLLALLLDGGLAAVIVYVGVRQAASEYDTDDRQTLTVFGLGGSLAFTVTIGATILIRLFEGRAVSEWPFLLLTSLAAGYLSGVVGGLYRVRAREETRRVQRTRDALAFVNGMLRHDVRNDANVISGYVSTIDADSETADVVRERAATVVQRTEQARAVAEAVAGEADPEPVDPGAVIDAAVESARTSFSTVTFETETEGGLTVRANEALRPVLDNLIQNAIQHHDRADPRVRVTAEQVDETVRIKVIDDGPGIPDAEKPELFEHDSPGTAKGLHVVSTIVNGLGGQVRVEDRDESELFDGESEEGDEDTSLTGTVFLVELPAVERIASDEDPEATADPFA